MMRGKKRLAMLLILTLLFTQTGIAAAASSTEIPDLEFEEGVEDWDECAFYGHNKQVIKGVAATCTKTGLTDGVRCSTCGKTLEPQVIIPKLEHKTVTMQGLPASCTDNGYTESSYCLVCKTVFAEKVMLPATGHKPVYTESKVPTCTEDGLERGSYCESCKEVLEAEKTIPATGHTLVTKTTGATFSAAGKTVTSCSLCETVFDTVKIAKVSTVNLSYTKKVYTGKSLTAPKLTVKDSKGKDLVKGTDYTVSGLTAKKSVGRYKVTVTLKGNYSGTKTLYFTIVPKKVSSATIKLNSGSKLSGYDDIKFSWKKATGAKGYLVYYKKSTASKYTYMTATTKTYVLKKNLSDGVKYTFKVIPYYKTSGGTTKYYSTAQYKTASVYTLKKIAGVKLSKVSTKSGAKVKVKWSNISGETGYQISKSTKKSGTNIVATYKTTKGTYKYISATKGKTYYYKVRAYKVVDGKKIYGPWSAAKKYKRK